jgi:hypothetical protein
MVIPGSGPGPGPEPDRVKEKIVVGGGAFARMASTGGPQDMSWMDAVVQDDKLLGELWEDQAFQSLYSLQSLQSLDGHGLVPRPEPSRAAKVASAVEQASLAPSQQYGVDTQIFMPAGSAKAPRAELQHLQQLLQRSSSAAAAAASTAQQSTPRVSKMEVQEVDQGLAPGVGGGSSSSSSSSFALGSISSLLTPILSLPAQSPPPASGSTQLKQGTNGELYPVVYPQVAALRSRQEHDGKSMEGYSLAELGLEKLDRCHHVTANQTLKAGPPSFRIRVCKRCCGGTTHIELGTYTDQESALLVNDAHEILAGRTDKLLVLRPDDREYLGMLRAKRYNKGKEIDVGITEILAEKWAETDLKKQQKVLVKRGFEQVQKCCPTDSPRDAEGQGSPMGSPVFPPTNIFSMDQWQGVLKATESLMGSSIVMGLYRAMGMQCDVEDPQGRLGRILDKVVKGGKGWELGMAMNDDIPFAASYVCLVSSNAPVGLGELGCLVRGISNIYGCCEGGACSGVDGLDCDGLFDSMEWVSQGNWAHLPTLLSGMKCYVRTCQCFLWHCQTAMKSPRWASESEINDSDSDSHSDTGMLAAVHRKFRVAAQMHRLLQFLVEQWSSCGDKSKLVTMTAAFASQSPSMTPVMLLDQMRGILVMLGVMVACLSQRLFDTSGSVEHLELALFEIDTLSVWLPTRPPLERLLVSMFQVTLRTSRARRRGMLSGNRSNGGVSGCGVALERMRSHVVRLLEVAEEMDLLTPASAQAGTADVAKLELQIMVLAYCFEYYSMVGRPLHWKPGFTSISAMDMTKQNLQALLELHGGDAEGQNSYKSAFLISDVNRALGTLVETCAHIAALHPKCAAFFTKLTQMAHRLLRCDSERFQYSMKVATATEGLASRLRMLSMSDNTLLADPVKPGGCYDDLQKEADGEVQACQRMGN